MTGQGMYDLVICGGGPAGLTAAIYAQRALLNTVVLEQESLGGQALLTSEIDNYPGVPHTDGFTLCETMANQATDLGAHIVMTSVERIERAEGGGFVVHTPESLYPTRTVILASGATPRHPGFVGEEKFAGHGVSYCATCDGMFYRGKPVYVIGGGNSACVEALFLTRFASNVTMVVRKDHLRAQAVLARQIQDNPKITVRYLTSVVAVGGSGLLDSITFRDNTTGKETTENYKEGSFGVFVFTGRVPASELVCELVELDEQGYIITNDRMETSIAGLYAAGDIRHKPLRQVVTAAADGAYAVNSVAAYLGQPVEG